MFKKDIRTEELPTCKLTMRRMRSSCNAISNRQATLRNPLCRSSNRLHLQDTSPERVPKTTAFGPDINREVASMCGPDYHETAARGLKSSLARYLRSSYPLNCVALNHCYNQYFYIYLADSISSNQPVIQSRRLAVSVFELDQI